MTGWPAIRAWRPEQGLLWVHLDRIGSATLRWLNEDSGLDPLMRDALLTEEVRPRALAVDDALLVILRGVNLNPGADPEDMVGVRIRLEPDRIVACATAR
jgi:zinc transporter